MRLLDLYCGAGGAAMGYHQAGFDIVGVDTKPQPNYPFEFVQADAIEYLMKYGCNFSVIHASPPCQRYSVASKNHNGKPKSHPDLVKVTRSALNATSALWIIENVVGAPLKNPILLCGTMFNRLRVLRHRLFESNCKLCVPKHKKHPLCFTVDKRKSHYGKLDEMTAFVQVTGGGNCSVRAAKSAMQIGWMTKKQLNNAIPPAYTKHIGLQLIALLTLLAKKGKSIASLA